MSRRAQENVVAVALLLVLLGFLVVSFTYGPRARMVPVPVAAVSIVILLMQLMLQNSRHAVGLNVDAMELLRGQTTVPVARVAPVDGEATGGDEGASTARPEAAEATAAATAGTRQGAREWRALGMVALCLSLILLIGILPAIAVFVFGYFCWIGDYRWHRALLYALLNAVATYLVFFRFLQIHHFPGWLLQWLS